MKAEVLHECRQKDPLVAFMWCEKAAANGSVDAKYTLASYYKKGEIVPQDSMKCYELTLQAAESKHAQAMLDVADYSKTGYGCEKNVERAIKYYKEVLSLSLPKEKCEEREIAQIATLELARIYEDCLDDGGMVAEALEYYCIAANMYDDPEANKKLAEWYELGIGVDKDVDKAAEHLTKYLCIKCKSFEHRVLARINYRKARIDGKTEVEKDMPERTARCVEIAYAYETGIAEDCYYQKSKCEPILAPDEEKAFIWYWRAYERGAKSAGLRCAEMLASGAGCKQNVIRARDIYVDLAKDDFLEAVLALAKMYRTGLLVESEGTESCMHWLMKASELGDEYSRYLIGLEYESRNGMDRDMQKAIYWYKRSHCEDAYLRLARCFRDGDGVVEDRKEAARYYHMCSSLPAMIEFSNMCEEQGERLWKESQNRKEAFYWFLRAARFRNPRGQLRIAEMYLHGNVVDVSLSDAARWNYWAAECHDPEGQWRFGAMCELGLGVAQSLEVAESYYRAASEQGHILAKLRLIELGRLPWHDIDALADSNVPEACYIRGMSMVQSDRDENLSSSNLVRAVKDFEIAADGGVSEALYGLYLCKIADSAVLDQLSDTLLGNAINKGSRYALLRWAKTMIDNGKANESIPMLWGLYAEGYKDASSLLYDAYDDICRTKQSDDAYVDIRRKMDLNSYLNARIAALETVHDKGKLSHLLWSFVSPRNDSLISAKSDIFNIEFNAYRENPEPIHDYDPADYDDRDDYTPRTFEDAYEIYGSRLWDA